MPGTLEFLNLQEVREILQNYFSLKKKNNLKPSTCSGYPLIPPYKHANTAPVAIGSNLLVQKAGHNE